MEIKRQVGEFNKTEIFNLTQGGSYKLSEQAGQVINMSGWLIYSDVDSKGEEIRVLAIRDNNGDIYATVSEVFITQFEKLADFMGDESYNIKVEQKTSKNGRNYITCVAHR